MRHCVCLAQVITVGSGAHVQAVKQLNGHDVNKERQPVFRALDARASSADSHVLQTIHSLDHGFVIVSQAFQALLGRRPCLVRHTDNSPDKHRALLSVTRWAAHL